MKRNIGYCGLDCERCDAYVATVNNDDELRVKTAKLWAEANNAPITPDMINCMGCRIDGVKTPYCDSMCEIRICALKKAMNTCGACADMNKCEKLGYILANSTDARKNLTDE